MDEQDWKNIVNELSLQVGQLSIDRALARADVQKAAGIIETLKAEIKRLNEEAAEIQTVTTTKKA